VEYRGIEYDVRMDMGARWIWTVHAPVNKQGKARGTRSTAVEAALKAIQNWCSRNATHKSAEDIVDAASPNVIAGP
jgi:hypothetical protein